MLSTERPIRYRIRVSRGGAAAALTHRAQIEALRGAVAASGLPAALDGRRKRPRPKMSFGPAISLGHASAAEYFDVELTERVDAERIGAALDGALGEGFGFKSACRIPAYYPSLEACINVAAYAVRGPFPADTARRVQEFLSQQSIVIEKVKQGGARVERVDVRPLIRAMTFARPDRLHLTLRFGPKRTVKPEALLRRWLGESYTEAFHITRTSLHSETAEGRLLTP